MATIKVALIVLILTGVACKSPQPATVKVVGLWPEEPPLSYKPFDTWTGGNCFIWPEVDAQPTLRWETFPRPADLTNGLASITAVSYDLRIWRNEGECPLELVYRRDALPAAAHRLEQPLPRATAYFWTVRPRFTLHGQPRVGDWSRLESPLPLGLPKLNGPNIYPDPRYYRFRTR